MNKIMNMDIVDGLYIKFDSILAEKTNELEIIKNLKRGKQKMTKPTEELNYNVKNTIAKINAEHERKLKTSKNYKKKEQQYLSSNTDSEKTHLQEQLQVAR